MTGITLVACSCTAGVANPEPVHSSECQLELSRLVSCILQPQRPEVAAGVIPTLWQERKGREQRGSGVH